MNGRHDNISADDSRRWIFESHETVFVRVGNDEGGKKKIHDENERSLCIIYSRYKKGQTKPV